MPVSLEIPLLAGWLVPIKVFSCSSFSFTLFFLSFLFLIHLIRAADGSNTKWTQCSFCKLVITSVNLWRHVRTQHTAQQPQCCIYCQKNFKNKYSLREHIRIAHEKQTLSSGGGKGSESGGQEQENPSEQTTDADIVVLKAEK